METDLYGQVNNGLSGSQDVLSSLHEEEGKKKQIQIIEYEEKKDLNSDLNQMVKVKDQRFEMCNWNYGVERRLTCKTSECPVKGKIIQYGKSNEACELYLNKHQHRPGCKKPRDLLKAPEMKILQQTNSKPSEIIKQFNNQSALKIIDNEAMRRKISQLKYVEKQKIYVEEEINNTKELSALLSSRHQGNIIGESFMSLNWNEPFISDYETYGDNFYAFGTKKNLIYNIVKQNISGSTYICVDGTYKLNNLGYSLIVIGTVDLHRKFHLGK